VSSSAAILAHHQRRKREEQGCFTSEIIINGKLVPVHRIERHLRRQRRNGLDTRQTTACVVVQTPVNRLPSPEPTQPPGLQPQMSEMSSPPLGASVERHGGIDGIERTSAMSRESPCDLSTPNPVIHPYYYNDDQVSVNLGSPVLPSWMTPCQSHSSPRPHFSSPPTSASNIHRASGSHKSSQYPKHTGASAKHVASAPRLHPIHVAARGGCTDTVKLLLERDPSCCHLKNSDGAIPLHGAAKSGSVDTFKLLLDAGSDIRARTLDGVEAIHLAAQYGYLDIVKLCLELGSDIRSRDGQGLEAIHFAAKKGRLDTVKVCLEAGSDIRSVAANRWATIHYAAQAGNLDVVLLCLDAGVDPYDVTDGENTSPMHIAALGGELFLERSPFGANVVSAVDRNGWAPIHKAARDGHSEAVRWLADRGADCDAPGSGGMCPIHFAAHEGYLEVTRCLIEHGADVNVVSRGLMTPLTWSAENGHFEVVKLLVANGANVDYVPVGTVGGLTAACFAAQEDHVDIVRFLLDNSEVEGRMVKQAAISLVDSSHETNISALNY